jgi:hypothetical protein
LADDFANLSSSFTVEQKNLATQYDLQGQFKELIDLTKKQNNLLIEQNMTLRNDIETAMKRLTSEKQRFYISTIIAIISVLIAVFGRFL